MFNLPRLDPNNHVNRRRWIEHSIFSSSITLASCALANRSSLSLFAAESRSADVQPRDIESPSFANKLEAIRSKNELPGLMAGVVTANGDTQIASCGLRKMGEDQSLLRNDLMHLGSCTKSMTATLAAMFVEEGLLQWNTKIRQVFHDIKPLCESDWADCTIEQLMEHTTGMVANPPWSRWKSESDLSAAREKIAVWLASQKRDKDASDNFHYSNLGYLLLGHAMERVATKPWESLIRERLFQPLQMNSAGFGSPVRRSDRPSSWGHIEEKLSGNESAENASSTTTKKKNWSPVDSDNPLVLGPAGIVHSTLEDWAKYLCVHLHSPKESDFPLPIGSSNWDRLHRPGVSDTYAGGWFVGERPWARGKIWNHNGSNTMWFCVTFVAPEIGAAIFAASNCGLFANTGCDEALQLVIRHLDH